MADPFVAEIRIFRFNCPPKGWAWCDGQLLPLSQNTALFSLLGTTYGGNGKSNFALPDLQGSAPLHPGQGSGLSLYDLGQIGGTETVTLLQSEIPVHTHKMRAETAEIADINMPSNITSLAYSKNGFAYAPSGPLGNLAFQSLAPAGGSLPHNNMMPYLTCYFNIALQGVFPPRG